MVDLREVRLEANLWGGGGGGGGVGGVYMSLDTSLVKYMNVKKK